MNLGAGGSTSGGAGGSEERKGPQKKSSRVRRPATSIPWEGLMENTNASRENRTAKRLRKGKELDALLQSQRASRANVSKTPMSSPSVPYARAPTMHQSAAQQVRPVSTIPFTSPFGRPPTGSTPYALASQSARSLPVSPFLLDQPSTRTPQQFGSYPTGPLFSLAPLPTRTLLPQPSGLRPIGSSSLHASQPRRSPASSPRTSPARALPTFPVDFPSSPSPQRGDGTLESAWRQFQH